jgi:hypothetical protein
MRHCKYSVKYGPTWWCERDGKPLVECVLESKAVCSRHEGYYQHREGNDAGKSQISKGVQDGYSSV